MNFMRVLQVFYHFLNDLETYQGCLNENSRQFNLFIYKQTINQMHKKGS